jgi:hypothetical protein
MATRRETQEQLKKFRWQYRELVVKGDLPGFEALLNEYGSHLTESAKREALEQFTRDAARALRFRWRSSK